MKIKTQTQYVPESDELCPVEADALYNSVGAEVELAFAKKEKRLDVAATVYFANGSTAHAVRAIAPQEQAPAITAATMTEIAAKIASACMPELLKTGCADWSYERAHGYDFGFIQTITERVLVCPLHWEAYPEEPEADATT